jgi:ATP adenylyltransferase
MHIHQHHMRAQRCDAIDCVKAIYRFPDHPEAGVSLYDRAQAMAYNRMIIDYQYTNMLWLDHYDILQPGADASRGIRRMQCDKWYWRPYRKASRWYIGLIMDTLWAPWRIGYIKGEKPAGCIFCEKVGEQNDEVNFILYRATSCFVILNLYPYTNGHLMVVPYRHAASIEDLSVDVLAELMALTQRALAVLREAMRPTGFNIGINLGTPAGAGMADHVHQHIVPRWVGDTNFMSVVGDTRVMPQSLQSCYHTLLPGFQTGAAAR